MRYDAANYNWTIMVKDFMDTSSKGTQLELFPVSVYHNLVVEEYEEWVKAFDKKDTVAEVDGLIDLIYVCVGRMLEMGLSVTCIQDLFEEVHMSNMDKFPDGVVTKDSNGKVVKPDGWLAPEIEGILRAYGGIE